MSDVVLGKGFVILAIVMLIWNSICTFWDINGAVDDITMVCVITMSYLNFYWGYTFKEGIDMLK